MYSFFCTAAKCDAVKSLIFPSVDGKSSMERTDSNKVQLPHICTMLIVVSSSYDATLLGYIWVAGVLQYSDTDRWCSQGGKTTKC